MALTGSLVDGGPSTYGKIGQAFVGYQLRTITHKIENVSLDFVGQP